MNNMSRPTERLTPPDQFHLHQRIHDTHWELHDIGYSLEKRLADAQDVRHTVAMLRACADALEEHARGMVR